VGIPVAEGDPLYCYLNTSDESFVVKKFEGKEGAFVDSVKMLGNESGTGYRNRVCITFRQTRNPSVGDKFASRAGQKGNYNYSQVLISLFLKK